MGNLSILRSKSLQYFLGKPCSSCSKRSSESDKRCEDVHKRKDIVSGEASKKAVWVSAVLNLIFEERKSK